MTTQFSDLVGVARSCIEQAQENKAARDIALFEIASYVADFEANSVIVLNDGRQAKTPVHASPREIFNMTFVGQDFKAQTLMEILQLSGNTVEIRRYLYSGAKKWAARELRARGYDVDSERAAEVALKLADESWPNEGQIGWAGIGKMFLPGNSRPMHKFHWRQIAWFEFWKTAVQQASGADPMEMEAAGLSGGDQQGGEYIAGLMTEQHRLRKALQEAQAAREAAEQARDEAVLQWDEAQRCLAEAVRQRDEAVRQKDEAEWQRDEAVRQLDEAAEDVHSQRAASAAVAAAVGPRVRRLEEQVAQLRSERDALAARLEQQLQQQQQEQQPEQQLQLHLHPQQLQLQSRPQHPGQQQQQQQLAESGPLLWCNNWSLPPPLPLPPLPTDTQPQKRQRLNGHGGDADHGHSSCHGGMLPDPIACATSGSHGDGGGGATTATTGTTSVHVRGDEAEGQPAEDVDGDPTAVPTAAVLCSSAEPKRHHNAVAAELEREGGRARGRAAREREGARQRQLQELVRELVVMQRRGEEQRRVEEAHRLQAAVQL
ncbi:hypothetical protein PLESTM_001311500 [Pleodorina starrii]|nr:hypothetical protein PLESTM_001311500 [Pleodorina starrii]